MRDEHMTYKQQVIRPAPLRLCLPSHAHNKDSITLWFDVILLATSKQLRGG